MSLFIYCSVCRTNPAGTERWQLVEGEMKGSYLCGDCERKEQEAKDEAALGL